MRPAQAMHSDPNLSQTRGSIPIVERALGRVLPHAEVIPGLKAYLAKFASEKAWGMDGYRAEKGMIPMPDAERKQFRQDAMTLKPLSM